jgi:hypothetical protein
MAKGVVAKRAEREMEYADAVTVLGPFILLIVQIRWTWLRDASFRHGTLVAASLASVGSLSRCMYMPREILYTDGASYGAIPASTLFLIDKPMCAPLKVISDVYHLHGKFPLYAWVAYTFLIYFAVYRIVGSALSASKSRKAVSQAVIS